MNGMYEELIEKLRKNNRMSGWTHIDRLIDEAAEAIEALQQENEQLRAQVARMREACVKGFSYLSLLFHRADIRNWGDIGMCSVKDVKHAMDELERAYKSSNTVQDYHNPADVEALRKAREALKGVNVVRCPYCWGKETHSDKCEISKAIENIDKVIGGKEDV